MLMYEIKISLNLGKIVLLHNILVVTKFIFYVLCIYIYVHEKSICLFSYMGDMYMYINKHTYILHICIYIYICFLEYLSNY